MYPIRRIDRMEYLAADARSELMSDAGARPRSQVALRLCPIALATSDVLAFIIAVFLAFAAIVATRPEPLERAIGNLLQLGTAWHGWGTLLVFVSLIGFFAARGQYTSRVPFWTQLGDVVMGCAVALACDTFLTVAVYNRPVEIESLLRWVFFCPCLLLLRASVRELLNMSGLWTINTLVDRRPRRLRAGTRRSAVRSCDGLSTCGGRRTPRRCRDGRRRIARPDQRTWRGIRRGWRRHR